MAKTSKKISNKIESIYMDYASSAKPNPGSIHNLGVKAKNELENARKMVAVVLNAHKDEIIFTSGGTESNNIAISGVVWSFVEKYKKNKSTPHIIISNIEHPSVLDTCRMLEQRGLAEVTVVPVDNTGIVDPKKIKKEIRNNTVLISIMYANNEVGAVEPIKEIGKEIRHFRKNKKNQDGFPLFHTDAVQAVNYLDLNVESLHVDMMTIAGSKIYNADKVGVFYKRRNVNISPIYAGGNQEYGLRPGTQDTEGIARFAYALEYTRKIKEKEFIRLTKLREYFTDKLKKINSEIIFNGDMKKVLPNIVNITIPNIPSDLLVLELDVRGVYVSSKSACKEGDGKASYVLEALNKNYKEKDGSIRFSFGRDTKKTDIDFALKSLKEILQKLKKWYS